MISFTGHIWVSKHTDRRQIVVARVSGKGYGDRLLNDDGVFLQGDENILELNRGG